jgi:uncharacterized membrane protein YsdA (DUF1294 family)/cold shock CspA family protein
MRIDGCITSWKDDKGFGFIRPDAGSEEIFVHVSAFDIEGRQPMIGERVSFSIGKDRRGRRCAQAVTPAGVPAGGRGTAPRGTDRPALSGSATLFVIPAFLLVMLTAAWLWRVPGGWFLLYAALSAVTFGLYAVDKAQAARDGFRVPEARLHLLAVVGGWPGALLAQQFLRHKSLKPSFRQAFWVTVALNWAGFLLLTSPPGREMIARMI